MSYLIYLETYERMRARFHELSSEARTKETDETSEDDEELVYIYMKFNIYFSL
jgi:hypothetical protein